MNDLIEDCENNIIGVLSSKNFVDMSKISNTGRNVSRKRFPLKLEWNKSIDFYSDVFFDSKYSWKEQILDDILEIRVN